MTNNEKIEILAKLSEEMLALQGVMGKSDAHASKCIKLGLDFRDTYPDDYDTYTQARERYNIIEAEYREVENTPVEPEIPVEPTEE